MNKEIFEPAVLKEADLDEIPEFYESLTDNPIADIVKNRKTAYDFIRLEKKLIIEATVPGYTFIPEFGIFIPGTITVTQEHGLKKITPFAFVYNNITAEAVFSGGIETNDKNIRLTLANIGANAATIRAQVYLYKFVEKR